MAITFFASCTVRIGTAAASPVHTVVVIPSAHAISRNGTPRVSGHCIRHHPHPTWPGRPSTALPGQGRTNLLCFPHPDCRPDSGRAAAPYLHTAGSVNCPLAGAARAVAVAADAVVGCGFVNSPARQGAWTPPG